MRCLPFISVVMPSLNQAAFLETAIRSVVDQGYPAFELIVIDGGSTDGSQDIIRRYEERLAYWISEPDFGQSDAINKGLARCRGDVFNWINSDDMLMPGALRSIGEAFQRKPDAELVVGTQMTCDQQGRVQRVSCPPSAWGRTARAWVSPFGQQSSFFAIENIRRLGGVREDLHCIMDNDLFYRHFRAGGRIHRIRNLIGIWRLHPECKRNCCGYEAAEERKRIFREYRIDPGANQRAWRKSSLVRLLDGSYLRSYILTRRYRGFSWQRLAEDHALTAFTQVHPNIPESIKCM